MKRAACVEDLRRVAQRRVPKMFYDYVDGGSWTERTYRSNASDLAKIELKQRVAVNVSDRSARSEILGTDVRMPVAMSPTGLTGVYWPNGEILAMKACESFGIPYTLSTVSIASIEDVARAAEKPFWFQLYVIRDRDFIARLMERAEAAGVETLVVTVDLQMSSQRNKDIYNGLSSPPRPTASYHYCFGPILHRRDGEPGVLICLHVFCIFEPLAAGRRGAAPSASIAPLWQTSSLTCAARCKGPPTPSARKMPDPRPDQTKGWLMRARGFSTATTTVAGPCLGGEPAVDICTIARRMISGLFLTHGKGPGLIMSTRQQNPATPHSECL